LEELQFSIDHYSDSLIHYAEYREWHLKYAKFNKNIHQSLLSHSLNVCGLSDRLYTILEPKTKSTARRRLLLAAFFHDIAKETESYQQVVKNWLNGLRNSKPSEWEQMNRDVINKGIRKFIEYEKLFLDQKEIDSIIWIITHMGQPESVYNIQDRLILPPYGDEKILCEIARLADNIMSIHNVEEIRNVKPDRWILKNLNFHFHKIGIIRGVLTQCLHSSIQKLYEKNSFIPIAWFPDGTVYVDIQSKKLNEINEDELQDIIYSELKHIFTPEREEEMGRSSFAGLTGSIIKSPEFLFFSEQTVKSFWNEIMKKSFANLPIAIKKSKKKTITQSANVNIDIDEMTKKISNLFIESGDDKDTSLIYAGIANSLSKIIQILNGAKNSIINKYNNSNLEKEKQFKKEIQKKLDNIIISTIQSSLKCNIISEQILNIANNSSPRQRFDLFKELALSSSLFQSIDRWWKEFSKSMVKCTLFFMKVWKKEIEDFLKEISLLLKGDLVTLSGGIDVNLVKAKEIVQKYMVGKQYDGTIICEECGGPAQVRANSPPFEKSQTYHDHLAAGQRIGKTNVINVCNLCRFERLIRSIFVENGKTFIIYPQLALSPAQRNRWEEIIKRITLDKIGTNLPPITYINEWSKLVIERKISPIDADMSEISSTIEKETSKKRLIHILKKSYDLDLETLISNIELSEKNKIDEYDTFEKIATGLIDRKITLTKHAENIVQKSLSKTKFLYGSSNFVLVVLPNIWRYNDEPESALGLRYIFISSILSKLFLSCVRIITSDSMISGDVINNGYVKIQSYSTFQNLYPKLGIKHGWIPISMLDYTLTRLACLMLIDSIFIDKNKASFGSDQLIKLSHLVPGEIVNRKLQESKIISSNLINYLRLYHNQMEEK
jgi:hypothetical protein